MTPTAHTKLRDPGELTNPGEKAAFLWEGDAAGPSHPVYIGVTPIPTHPRAQEHGVIAQGAISRPSKR